MRIINVQQRKKVAPCAFASRFLKCLSPLLLFKKEKEYEDYIYMYILYMYCTTEEKVAPCAFASPIGDTNGPLPVPNRIEQNIPTLTIPGTKVY